MSRQILRRQISLPLGIWPPTLSAAALARTGWSAGMRQASSMPTLAQPAFWKALVPKPLRRNAANGEKPKSKEWNPATFFIAIFLLIGSMSIQMIALKKDFATFTRQSDVRIGLLREVVEKLQRGEEVDVEKVLGAGDPEKEIEWQEVLDEIEKEDVVRERKRKQAAPAPTQKQKEPSKKEEPPNDTVQTSSTGRASFF